MGASPLHSTTVGLVRNLQTGTITPQYHLVYDDFFETAFADDDEAPEEWDQLLVFSRFQTEFDDPDYVPQLDDEWLSPEERHDRRLQQSRLHPGSHKQDPNGTDLCSPTSTTNEWEKHDGITLNAEEWSQQRELQREPSLSLNPQ